ncbi:Uncharacterised protein [Bordetella pertussis]|nr:Uncharacterised protein [Bordetella pertussis]CFM37058.1 Uncharacterised protein [Bordetella pertussis]CFN06226.1 Uncharacterised protein [Bordetella pertussis]CFN65202.1 Uncharacterised protein [Bordetella pertussis]CFO02306.1 Uncharacterised protein [Bordetella pertussis]
MTSSWAACTRRRPATRTGARRRWAACSPSCRRRRKPASRRARTITVRASKPARWKERCRTWRSKAVRSMPRIRTCPWPATRGSRPPRISRTPSMRRRCASCFSAARWGRAATRRVSAWAAKAVSAAMPGAARRPARAPGSAGKAFGRRAPRRARRTATPTCAWAMACSPSAACWTSAAPTSIETATAAAQKANPACGCAAARCAPPSTWIPNTPCAAAGASDWSWASMAASIRR